MYEDNGYKNPTLILSLLTKEGIAYWFMDDVRGDGRVIGKYKDHSYQLATCCFTREHNEYISDYFNNLGYVTKVSKITNQSKKIYDIVCFDLSSSRKISEEIRPYFVNCMLYKLQNSTDIIHSYRTIDQDELIIQSESVFGFQWSDKRIGGARFGRKRIAIIKKECKLKIKEIKIIGKQELIDLHVDTFIPYLHSFYANNILVHNSAHTNILCIEGNCKLTANGNHPLVASKLFKQLEAGQDTEILTYNHETDKMEYQKPCQWLTSHKDVYTLKTKGRGYRGRFSLDHKIYIFNKGYVPLSEIKAGDFVVINEQGVKLLEEFDSITLWKKDRLLYDFNTKNHNFFVENMLVHNCLDELDLCDPMAYEEAKLIPDVFGKQFPLTVRLSTRKFAFGLMEQAIREAPEKGERVLRWNILDVTEYCPNDRCKPKQPKQIRYIPRSLPLAQFTEEQYGKLEERERNDLEKIECYEGCTECQLLSVCRMKLHDVTPKTAVSGFYKPIVNTINTIKKPSADVASAQLLCLKPSTKGLVYPRFSPILNVASLPRIWEIITGVERNYSMTILQDYIRNLGVRVEAGIDWGYTNEFSIVVGCFLPSGISIILDMFSAPDLELDDCLRIAAEMQAKYNIDRFWADPSYPAYIRTFNKKGLKCPKFTKDVPMGIESVRGRVVDAGNKRNMFILKQDNTERLISAFGTYHWKIDSAGNPTDTPAHTEESDMMDAIRYLYQNVYGKTTSLTFSMVNDVKSSPFYNQSRGLSDKIKELAVDDKEKTQFKSKKKILHM